MSQCDTYEFLKANKDSWFSTAQMAKALGMESGLVGRSVNKLCYWNLALRRHNEKTRCDEFMIGPGREANQ